MARKTGSRANKQARKSAQPRVSAESRRRCDLIASIEEARATKVITYFLSDRRGVQAQIAEDAVRPMYDHLRVIGPTQKIDLFLYSVGGKTEVPWRLVTMIREFAKEFNVLIPYKAMSAATLIALGADRIIIGPKGELGPIDPQLSIERGGAGGTVVQEQIAVEDIMSYVRFLREKAQLTDQAALSGPISVLAEKLDPWVIGNINRAHSHIRSVARKLLMARSKGRASDEQRIEVIVEALAEKTYQHGHAIGRTEAEEIGLKIERPKRDIEDAMWALYEEYEDLCRLRNPLDPLTFVPQGQDDHSERVTMGAIESVGLAHHFAGEVWGRNKRQVPPQLALNLNLNLQLPPEVPPQQLPAGAQQALQRMLEVVQRQLPGLVQEELRRQMPVVGFKGWTQDGAWRQLDGWPAAT